MLFFNNCRVVQYLILYDTLCTLYCVHSIFKLTAKRKSQTKVVEKANVYIGVFGSVMVGYKACVDDFYYRGCNYKGACDPKQW